MRSPPGVENDDEAHVPAEQPPTPQNTRVSRPHADEERAPGPEAAPGERAAPPHRVIADERFRPPDRIRKRAEYQTVYDRGQRIPSSSFVLFVLRNSAGRPRLGITVTKRVGNAVRRNRAKRLIREIFRRHKAGLMNIDIVVNGRSVLPDAPYRRVEAEFLARLGPYRRTT